MPKQKTKYNPKWEDLELADGVKFCEWLSQYDDHTAYCNRCKKQISVATLGKKALIKHHESKLHKGVINVVGEEIEHPSNENQETNDTLDEKTCKAEILWSIATAEHDISFAINDHKTFT